MSEKYKREKFEWVMFSCRLKKDDADELMRLSKILVKAKKIQDIIRFSITRFALLGLLKSLRRHHALNIE